MGRRLRTKAVSAARELGLEVALGVDTGANAREPDPAVRPGCPQCGRPGRIDIVDAAAQRAYLTCRSCGCAWATARLDVGSG